MPPAFVNYNTVEKEKLNKPATDTAGVTVNPDVLFTSCYQAPSATTAPQVTRTSGYGQNTFLPLGPHESQLFERLERYATERRKQRKKEILAEKRKRYYQQFPGDSNNAELMAERDAEYEARIESIEATALEQQRIIDSQVKVIIDTLIEFAPTAREVMHS